MSAAIERRVKRQKLDHVEAKGRTNENSSIQNAFQLEDILRFRQDIAPLKEGLRSFKDFLTSFTQSEDGTPHGTKLKILKEYCDGQPASQPYSPTLPDLFKIWSFAAETRNESLLTNVPAVLAQLLKLISTYLEFRDFGLSLCETLLYPDQIWLLDRGLNAPPHKPHLISPCLRLLTEVVSFDGGALAGDVFEKRDVLFKRLESLLKEKVVTDDEEVDRTKPTLRSNAVRFVIANLQYQDVEVKSDLVLQGRLLQAAFRGIENDHPDTVQLFLQAIDKNLIDDARLKISIKSKFLSAANLVSISKLLEYESDLGDLNASLVVQNLAQGLLMKICLQPKYGLLQSSRHSPVHIARTRKTIGSDLDRIDLGPDSPFLDENTGDPPSRDDQLAVFIRSLRPEMHATHSKILLAIFSSSPDLLADYFVHKSTFKAAVKDESDWRAEFAFLFQVVQIPAEDLIKQHIDSPLHESVLIESILPRPLTQAILTKWINSNDEIVSMSATRIITAALQRLEAVLTGLVTGHDSALHQTASRLKLLFLQRCPVVTQLDAAAARAPKTNDALRYALISCLATFLTIFPEHSRAIKFDITKPLTESLQRLLQEDLTPESRTFVSDQAQELLTLSDRVGDTRWWQASGMWSFSSWSLKANEKSESGNPTTCNLMLRVLASTHTAKTLSTTLKRTLEEILLEKGIIRSKDSWQALIMSLNENETEDWFPSSEVFTFIDSCMHRIVHKPIRYVDMVANAQQKEWPFEPLSLLAYCAAEQWPYLVKNSERIVVTDVVKWIYLFFWYLEQAKENFGLMDHLRLEMSQVKHELTTHAIREACGQHFQRGLRTLNPMEEEEIPRAADTAQTIVPTPLQPVDLNTYFPSPPPIPPSISGLDRWTVSNLTAPDFTTHQLPSLLRLLSSPDTELRTLAFHSLTSLHHLLSTTLTATLPSAPQFHLLTGELLETIRSLGTTPIPQLPSVLPELATLASRLLPHPTDPTYPKISRFLLKSPSWNTAKILTYWSTQFLLRAPAENNSVVGSINNYSNGDSNKYSNSNSNKYADSSSAEGKTSLNDRAHALEVERFLQILNDGLRTTEDLEMYRRQGVWERCFALVFARSSSSAGDRDGGGGGDGGDMKVTKRVLTLVYRALQVEGGKGREMLIRRAGVGGWLRVVEGRLGEGGAAGDDNEEDVRELRDVVGQLRKMVDEGLHGENDGGAVDPIKDWRERLPAFHMKKNSGTADDHAGEGVNGIEDEQDGDRDDDVEMEDD